MRPRSTLAIRSTIILVAMVQIASTAPLDERVDPRLPDIIVKTEGLADGGALVLGSAIVEGPRWASIKPKSRRVVRVAPDGAVASEPVPDVGEPLDIAGGVGAWVLGPHGVAVRGSGGGWRRIELAPRIVDPSDGRIVAIDATHAIAIRIGSVDGTVASAVDAIDATSGTAVALLTLPGYQLAPAVADGSGGMWTMVTSSATGSAIGYAKYAHGAWTVWLASPTHPDELTRAGFHIDNRAAVAGVYTQDPIVPDGRGGWFGRQLDDLVHVTADGAGSVIRDVLASPEYMVKGLAWDPIRDRLLVLLLADRRKDDARVVELDRDGKQVGSQAIPTPAWYRNGRNRPPRFDATIAASATTTWISFGPLVFTQRAAAWRVAFSPELEKRVRLLDETERRDRGQRRRTARAYGVGLTTSSVLVGTLGATAIHGARDASLGFVGGVLGAFAPALLIDGTLPATWSDENGAGPGMPRLAPRAGCKESGLSRAWSGPRGLAAWGLGAQASSWIRARSAVAPWPVR